MDPTPVTPEATLAALDVPWSDALARSTAGVPAHDLWRHVPRLFTAATAKDLWTRWNPQQAGRGEEARFLEHFRDWLADGLALGYRLDRFRGASARLPDPHGGARNWIPFFEDSVAGEDCCTFRLFLSREQLQAFRASNRRGAAAGETWDGMLSMMADGLFYELGLVWHPPGVLVDEALSPPWFRCEWNDLRLPPRRGLDDHRVLVNDTVERLARLDIRAEAAVHPANGQECAVIDKSYEALAKDAGLTTWDSRGYTILAVSAAIRRCAAALVNRSLYQLYVLRLREYCPDLVAVVEGAMEPDFLVQVLRGLLAEEISIRDLSTILQAVLELRSVVNVEQGKYIVFGPPTGGTFFDDSRSRTAELVPADYVEFVRWSLKRYISHKYTRGQSTLLVYLLDRDAEEWLAGRDEVDGEAEAALLAAVKREVGSLPTTANSPVILTTSEVRQRLRRLVAPELPDLTVLSYQELSPDMNIQPIARIEPER